MVDGTRRFGAFVVSAVFVVVWVAACSGPVAQPPSVVSVAIDGGDVVTDEGGYRVLSATVAVQGGAATTVAWATDDPLVATIDASGTLTGVGEGTTNVRATSTVDATKQATVAVRVQASGAGATLWTRQFGVAASETGRAVAIDADGRIAFAAGTNATTTGHPNDLRDAVVIVLEGTGNPVWERSIETFTIDDANGVATTSTGRVVAVGDTRASLEAPGAHLGATDAFVRTYEANGALAWTRQFGTPNGDTAHGVAVGPGDRIAVVGGSTGAFDGTPRIGASDAFVRLYEPTGDLAWTTKFGSEPGATIDVDGGTTGLGVAVGTDGRVVVAGRARGTLAAPHAGNFDAFVRAYTPTGEAIWTVQFGTSPDDVVHSVAIGPDGRVAVAGYTRGALDGAHAGGADVFVRLYERDGALAWARQFGTSGEDEASAVGIDAAGNVLVAGRTAGALTGTSAGGTDAFVRKYDPYGAVRWTSQFGTSGSDAIAGLAVDLPTGEIVVVGTTSGALGGPNAGANDVFLRRMGP